MASTQRAACPHGLTLLREQSRVQARNFELAEGRWPPEHVRRSHGGHYLNVGCSDLIVEGEIGPHYDDIERFAADDVLMKDSSLEKADYIALQI